MSLIGATTNTTCGTINSVNESEGASLEAQTYTVPCPPTIEPTLSVFVYDDTFERPYNIMNIAEVMVYSQINGKALGKEKRENP